jgi:hypothetical protein
MKEKRGLKRKDNTRKVGAGWATGLGKLVFSVDYVEGRATCELMSDLQARLIRHSSLSFAWIICHDGWMKVKMCDFKTLTRDLWEWRAVLSPISRLRLNTSTRYDWGAAVCHRVIRGYTINWWFSHQEMRCLLECNVGRPPLWSSGQSFWPDPEVPGSIPDPTRFSEK